MFDLDGAIKTWRTRLDQQTGISKTDQEEMEADLCEEIEDLISSGLSPREAYFKAVRNFGSETTVAKQLREVQWEQDYSRRLKAQPALLGNYLTVAFRNLFRHKVYSIINISGLAVGMACCALILLYVQYELNYDTSHTNHNQIHRVAVDRIKPDGSKTPTVWTENALIAAMVEEIPEIEHGARLSRNPRWGKATLKNSDYTYYDDQGLYVDTSFFDVFTFPFVQGNTQSAFVDPSSIVLTQSLSQKFFGTEDALGKTLTFNHYSFKDKAFKVSAVIEDVPLQSHFTFDFLVPIPSTLSTVGPWKEGSWASDGTTCGYFKIHPEAPIKTVEAKIQQLVEDHKPQTKDIYTAQPLTGLNGIHLASHRGGELSANSNKLYIKVLLSVALFAILIAGINYVNLATAKSALRVKEIGVRKVVGAPRKSLISQFLTESILLATFAGLLAVVLTEAALPYFNAIMQKQLSLFAQTNQPILFLMIASIFVIGLIAGLYPAFYLSRFKPISAIKNRNTSTPKKFNLRQGLVVFQFGLAAVLMVGVFVVQKQLNYIQSADLGFEKDQVVIVSNFAQAQKKAAMRRALREIPNVIQVGAANEHIGLIGLFDEGWTWNMSLTDSNDKQPILWTFIEHNYLDVLGIELKEGRFFSPKQDKPLRKTGNPCILNETAVKRLGISEPAIGQKIATDFGYDFTIVGIVKDFHLTSLHENIKPFVFAYSRADLQYGAIKITGNNINGTLSEIRETWTHFLEGAPLDFYFLDSAIDQQYQSEQNFRTLFSAMTSLSLIIACLGLFGLAAFTAAQRTKEIGIRKVLGASTISVITLLAKEFVKFVLIANIVVWPIAYWVMSMWLDNFAYRTEIGALTFLIVGGLTLVIATLTVSTQAIRVATTNPVESLRYE